MPEAPVLRDVYDKIRVVELQWIPMADGRRLAARLWLPNDAEQNPVPPRFSNTSPIAGATAPGCATTTSRPGWPRRAMSAPASTSPAAAIPTACCATNI